MTSCIPIRHLTINGSLNNLSSLALLQKNSKFVRTKNQDGYYYPDTIKMAGEDGQTFRIAGEIKLKKNGRIHWKKSSLSRISFRDSSNRSKNYQITDHWQFDFDLKSLIQSSPKNYATLLLREGFALRGGNRKNVIDFTGKKITQGSMRLPISGGAGADSIRGSENDDNLAASTSRDICDFGTGTNLGRKVKDVLTGNGGKDTFYADNGTRVTDIEVGETIHLFNHNSYDLDKLKNKTPTFKHRANKTVIKIGELKIITNPARFDFSYQFYTSKFKMCKTDSDGTICDTGWIPGEPEGYSFTATEIV